VEILKRSNIKDPFDTTNENELAFAIFNNKKGEVFMGDLELIRTTIKKSVIIYLIGISILH